MEDTDSMRKEDEAFMEKGSSRDHDGNDYGSGSRLWREYL